MKAMRFFKMFRKKKKSNEEYENFLRKKISIICVMGPKSCGNTVISYMLAECSKFEIIDVSKLLVLYSMKSDLSSKASVVTKCMEKDKLVPDDIVVHILKEEILLTYESVDGFIISGFPRNLSQMKLFIKHIYNVNVIIHINLELDAFLTRLLFTDSKIDINEARIKFIKYNKKLKPIRKEYEDKTLMLSVYFQRRTQ